MSNRSGIWQDIAGALRAHRLHCVLLNLALFAIVWSYYSRPGVAEMWQGVADFRIRSSFAFSFVATIFAAAILPYTIQWLYRDLPAEGRWKRLLALVAFWGYRGMEIDLLYRLQAHLFGHGHDVRTLAIKVAVDQFVYSALWAVPTYVVALRWVECGCSWRRARATLDRSFWTRTYPTVLVTNWLIWIPAVALVYSLPAALQFPLFTMVMCFFVLIATLLARVRPEGASLPA